VGGVGGGEVREKTVMTTIRAKAAPDRPYNISMSVEELKRTVLAELEGKPRRPHYLPMLLSKRPIFR